MPDYTIGGLPPASGINGNWFSVVSSDGKTAQRVNLRDWPVSNPVAAAIAKKTSPSDFKTINGQSIYGVGNIVISTGGSPAWGAITGTLADQTDLQSALDAKASLASDNTFTGQNKFGRTYGEWQALTYAATQALDAAKQWCTLTLTGNVLFNSVTGTTAGDAQVITCQVTQDATGSRLASFTTSVFAAPAAGFPTLTATAGAIDVLIFTKLSSGKWLVTSALDVRSS